MRDQPEVAERGLILSNESSRKGDHDGSSLGGLLKGIEGLQCLATIDGCIAATDFSKSLFPINYSTRSMVKKLKSRRNPYFNSRNVRHLPLSSSPTASTRSKSHHCHSTSLTRSLRQRALLPFGPDRTALNRNGNSQHLQPYSSLFLPLPAPHGFGYMHVYTRTAFVAVAVAVVPGPG